MNKILFRNVLAYFSDLSSRKVSFYIDKSGKVNFLDSYDISSFEEVVEEEDLVIMPLLTDVHTHMRVPGQEEKEDIVSGSKAAARGGFGQIFTMPNTNPVVDNAYLVDYLISNISKNSVIKIYPVGAVSRNQLGEELSPLLEMKNSGAIAFSDDGKPISTNILRKALIYVKTFDGIIIDHPEDIVLSGNGIIHEGKISRAYGINSIPYTSEEICVARDIALTREIRSRLHLAHLSTRHSLKYIEAAKEEGLNVTSEVTVNHLIFNCENIPIFDTRFKVKPPFRDEEDMNELFFALQKGLIDVVCTDHAPHTLEEKELDYSEAPFGTPGLETAFAALYTYFVMKNKCKLEDIIKWMVVNPSKIFSLPILELKNRSKANFFIFKRNKEFLVEPEMFFSKCKLSVFLDKTLFGFPLATFYNGNMVYKDKNFMKNIKHEV
ncbi:MAG TPA: dihydroorotase [Thermodesulfobium narugense]|nr:MAG: dihydroorotase [Thermodesulfobium narugense]HEM55222.1 dihydroorotase [Thermodesulfobium narugense]